MILMGIIYKANILIYRSAYSLYYTPTLENLWHVIDFIYFMGFYTSVLCYPKKQLSVGKIIVLFKCQLHFKQYIKLKSIYVLKQNFISLHLKWFNIIFFS